MLEKLLEGTVSKDNLIVMSESVANHHVKTTLNPTCPKFEAYSEEKTAINEPQTANQIC